MNWRFSWLVLIVFGCGAGEAFSIRRPSFAFLNDLHSPQAMAEYITTHHHTFQHWNSYDQTAFVRRLRDQGAQAAILAFLPVARGNVYLYTAAISALAQSETYQQQALELLGE